MTAWAKLPELLADEQAGLRWWVCLCGRHLSEHPWVNTDSNRWLRCALRDTVTGDGKLVRGRFESETRRVEYDPRQGLRVRPTTEPTLA